MSGRMKLGEILKKLNEEEDENSSKIKLFLEDMEETLDKLEKNRREIFRKTGEVYYDNEILEKALKEIKKLEKRKGLKEIVKRIEKKLERINSDEDLKEEAENIYELYMKGLEVIGKQVEILNYLNTEAQNNIEIKEIKEKYEKTFAISRIFNGKIGEYLGEEKMVKARRKYEEIKNNLRKEEG